MTDFARRLSQVPSNRPILFLGFKMALSTMKTSLIIIFILSLIFVFALEEAEARRGGGGRGGSRGGSRGRTRSRGSSSSGGGGSRPKNYNNVVLSGRIVKGSSPYNKGTWKKAAAAGLIFGGALYLTRSRTSRMYNDRMPIICTNKSYRSPEGKRYDYFICPLPDQNVTLKYCCGPKHGEYCCDKATAQRYYGEHHGSSSSSPAGIIVGILLVIIVICILVYCFKNRNSGPMSKIFKSKRRTRDESDLNLNHTNKHIKQSDSHHHGAPDHPPPYSSSAAYDGSAGLPYAPPPPQMPGGFAAADPSTAPYPNASAPYPPPQAANPYPPPLDGAVNPPYPPPPDGGMNPPYPPMAPGAGNPPYPAPYPSEVPPYPGGVPAPAPSYDSYAA
ncbi:protein shisa-4-like, partial [Plakobranchus ocellatus]